MKPAQIRAGRAYLGWSQSELADRTGLSVPTIANIEVGRSEGSHSTLEKIAAAYERAGLSLTKNGLEKRDVPVIALEGASWFEELLEDVYYTLLDKKDGELLIFGGNNKISPPEIIRRFRKIRNAGIKMREMVEHGDDYLMGPVSEYRWIPKEFYKNYVKLIYGSKICLDFGETGLLIEDQNMADVERNQFELVWKILPPLSCESKAHERY
jgi:transcriptional regulator with XRE-family HTH domain